MQDELYHRFDHRHPLLNFAGMQDNPDLDTLFETQFLSMNSFIHGLNTEADFAF
jgi:hypothetical protein